MVVFGAAIFFFEVILEVVEVLVVIGKGVSCSRTVDNALLMLASTATVQELAAARIDFGIDAVVVSVTWIVVFLTSVAVVC